MGESSRKQGEKARNYRGTRGAQRERKEKREKGKERLGQGDCAKIKFNLKNAQVGMTPNPGFAGELRKFMAAAEGFERPTVVYGGEEDLDVKGVQFAGFRHFRGVGSGE